MYLCSAPACTNEVRVESNKKHSGLCKRHGAKGRVTSDWVKKNRHRIVRVTEQKNGRVRYVLRCPTESCSGEVLSGKRNATCKGCADASKRKEPYRYAYNKLVKSGKVRHIAVELTYEDFVLLCSEGECHYCNLPLHRAQHRSKIGSTAPLLDRKDSALGYTKTNCVPCCSMCNFTKGAYVSYEEMMLIMRYRGLR